MLSEKRKEQMRVYSKEHRKEQYANLCEWRRKHPETCKRYQRKYYLAHVDERRAYQREYYRRKKGGDAGV